MAASQASSVSPDNWLASLRTSAPWVLPSLLNCDFGDLAGELRALEEAAVQALHLDVMDGHFVPNLTFGPAIVSAIRRRTSRVLDVHLMIAEPEKYIDEFIAAGADVVTIHVEAADDPKPLLQRIRAAGCVAGLAFNPETPASAVQPFADDFDLLLVMSVSPGFGGQMFDSSVLEKVGEARSWLPEETLIEIDGGVNNETVGDCASAGIDLLVVGSAIFSTDDYASSIAELRRRARLACS